MKRRVKRSAALTVLVICSVVFVAADRLTKAWAVDALASGPKAFIPKVFDFTLVFNEGAAWGIFSGARWAFLLLAVFVLAVVVIYFCVNKDLSVLEVAGLSLLAAGAIGNAIDRALGGAVVDFIRTLFMDFPVFNVADCCITVGVVLFIISVFISFHRQSALHDSDLDEA